MTTGACPNAGRRVGAQCAPDASAQGATRRASPRARPPPIAVGRTKHEQPRLMTPKSDPPSVRPFPEVPPIRPSDHQPFRATNLPSHTTPNPPTPPIALQRPATPSTPDHRPHARPRRHTSHSLAGAAGLMDSSSSLRRLCQSACMALRNSKSSAAWSAH